MNGLVLPKLRLAVGIFFCSGNENVVRVLIIVG